MENLLNKADSCHVIPSHEKNYTHEFENKYIPI